MNANSLNFQHPLILDLKKNVLHVNRSTSKVIIVQSGALKFKCKIKTREAHFFIAF